MVTLYFVKNKPFATIQSSSNMHEQEKETMCNTVHNTRRTSEKYYFDIFSPYNRNRAVFVPDAVAVVKSTSICSCGFVVVRFYAVITRLWMRLRLFDPSLINICCFVLSYIYYKFDGVLFVLSNVRQIWRRSSIMRILH